MASTPSVATVKAKRGGYVQRRLGPAPFASFEDLSDDLESPEEKPVTQPLPGIKEDVRMADDGTLMSPESTASGSVVCGGGTGSLQTPSTPRIDISRASSSSHHDSNNSSPERELFAGAGETSGGAKLGLGFKEEGTADLRSSTEELDYHEEPGARQEKLPNKKLLKYELEAQSEKEAKERKDSACSDAGLLSISGRTSRLSSVGSAASGGSAASHVSHLSVVSGLSRASSGRSPSPHKMLLETSFCGNKPIPSQSIDLASSPIKYETESLEKVLLSRSTDPTRAAVIQDKELQKPLSLNLSEAGKSTKTVQSFSQLVQNKPAINKVPDTVTMHVQSRPVTPKASDSTGITPSASPKLSKHVILKKKEESGSRTPSPSLSRKSSFSIFKKTETVVSPESPTVPPGKRKSGTFTTILMEAGEGLRDRSRSRSKSRERVVQPEQKDIKGKKDNKNKGVFSNLFKKKEKKKGTKSIESETISPNEISSPESKLPLVDPISSVEFTFDMDNIQPSEFGIIRKENVQEQKNVPIAHNAQELTNGVQENLLPSESVMLPAPSHLIHESEVCESVERSINLHFPVEDEFIKLENQPIDAVIQEHLSLVEETSMQVTPSASEDAEHLSSESERDSEVEYLRAQVEALKKQEQDEEEDDHERKRLVFQQDSFEDELPYVPTTLPQERSVAVPIVPIKQRVSEVRTCPIERPRSTTPINPSLLEEYVQCSSTTDDSDRNIEKMRISLPREDSIGRNKLSRRGTITAKSWVEFAEHGLQSPREFRKASPTSPPPPLPPRAQPTPPLPITPPPKPSSWINFEEIPEKRKPAKRIQTIPSRGSIDLPEASKVQVESSKTVVYSYVNPEDCKCECHEVTAGTKIPESSSKSGSSAVQCSHQGSSVTQQNSSNSDGLYDDYAHPYLEPGVCYSEGLKPMKPFGMDLDVSSNRSSIISQDEPQSPDAGSPVIATRTET